MASAIVIAALMICKAINIEVYDSFSAIIIPIGLLTSIYDIMTLTKRR